MKFIQCGNKSYHVNNKIFDKLLSTGAINSKGNWKLSINVWHMLLEVLKTQENKDATK